MYSLGQTRTAVRSNYILHAPDSFVRAPLPGMAKATAIVHAAPPIGAAFTQYTAEIEPGGRLGPAEAQRFVYVLEGELSLEAEGRSHKLTRGGYVLLPEMCEHRVTARGKARAAVIEKPYLPLPGAATPELVVGKEGAVKSHSLAGDRDLQVRSLIPARSSFDLAVNVMTYAPGAALPMVECHVMEHGLLMLDGAGIYRLGNDWHPVAAGDFIWMGSFCPQWFGALGKTPARYLIYKDWNRHPLA